MSKLKIFRAMRIACCVIATAAAAIAVPVFMFLEIWGLVPVGVAVVFTVLMMLFKGAQEREEIKLNPPAPQGDFIHGKTGCDKK